MTLSGTVVLALMQAAVTSANNNMIIMIMEFVQNRSFTLTTGDNNQSRLCRLKNFSDHVRLSLHDFQKVYLRRKSCILPLFWKLEGFRGDFKSRHDYIFSISLNLKVEAQLH